MVKVIAKQKRTREIQILANDIPEKEAERFCEMWGWNYCDENGISWWLSWEE